MQAKIPLAGKSIQTGHVVPAYGNFPGSAVYVNALGEAAPAVRKPSVGIHVSPKANELERFAADELSGYLKKLFDIEALADAAAQHADVHLIVGTPQSNPAVGPALDEVPWPPITDQGIVLRKSTLNGKPALIIGGGSDAATLWAVYELVERWGVRYLLHGDLLPAAPAAFRLPDEDLVLEPNLRVRQWRTVNDFACGPESWGLEEHRRVIDQLAKLKFNRIFVNIYPYQPFLDLETQGIRRRTAALWYDFRYPITDDMPGRRLFGSEPEFWNPDLPQRGAGYDAFARAGERLVQGIFSHAKRRGMQTAINANVMEFPAEFAPRLTDSEKVNQLGAMWIVPGPKTGVDDPSVTELAAAVLRTTVETYRDLDYVLLGMPEWRQWMGEFERAWQVLDRKYRVNAVVGVPDVVSAAERRTDYPGGTAQRRAGSEGRYRRAVLL